MTLLSLAPPAAPRCPAHQGQGPALCTSSPSLITPHALWHQPCNQIMIDPSLLLNQCHRLGTGGPIQTPLQEMEDCSKAKHRPAHPNHARAHMHTHSCALLHTHTLLPIQTVHVPRHTHTHPCTHKCAHTRAQEGTWMSICTLATSRFLHGDTGIV